MPDNATGSIERILERASVRDADEIAALYLASRAEALPYVRCAHTDDEVRAWVGNIVLMRGGTWVVRVGGILAAFMTLVGSELEHLYVLPGFYRQGLGRKLVDLAKTESSARVLLYTFQRNAGARAFYESQGFRIIGMTDGSHNEEHEPDIRYEWTP